MKNLLYLSIITVVLTACNTNEKQEPDHSEMVNVKEVQPARKEEKPGNDTLIKVIDSDIFDHRMNSSRSAYAFPQEHLLYEKIIMQVMITCPDAGCDEYDRIASFQVLSGKGRHEKSFELGRVITPGGRPCSWEMDVTDYRSLLTGNTTLGVFISTQSTGGKGLVVDVSFKFTGGKRDREIIEVDNLLSENSPYRRLSHFNLKNFDLNKLNFPSGADHAKILIRISGHSGEKIQKSKEKQLQKLTVGNNTYSEELQCNDCESTPCFKQTPGNKNGINWCSGMIVPEWEIDIPADKITNQTSDVNYMLQPASCFEYPYYIFHAQVIYYKRLNEPEVL